MYTRRDITVDLPRAATGVPGRRAETALRTHHTLFATAGVEAKHAGLSVLRTPAPPALPPCCGAVYACAVVPFHRRTTLAPDPAM